MATTNKDKDIFFSTDAYGKEVILRNSAERRTKIFDAIIEQEFKKEKELADRRAKVESDLKTRIQALNKKSLEKELTEAEKAELSHKKSVLAQLVQMDTEYKKTLENINTRAIDVAAQYELNSYKELTRAKRYEHDQNIKKDLKSNRDALKEKEQILKDAIAAETDAEKKKNLRNELDKVVDEKRNLTNQIKAVDRTLTRADAKQFRKNASYEHAVETAEIAQNQFRLARSTKKEILSNVKNSEAYRLAKKNHNKEQMKQLEAQAKDTAEYRAAEANEEAALHDLKMSQNEELAANTKAVGAAFKNIAGKAANEVNNYIDDMFGQQGRMMGRLQESSVDWKDAVDDISDTIGFSNMVSKKSVIAKMVELVDSGVAYNLEMRAFLATTSENIASTFNATNGTLLRLIRLQQADTTAARLGMEASLTKLFNEFFDDTAYLAADVSESVTNAILDASMTMSKNDSLEFEYMMQKWLGTLYSLGMSDQGVQTIAQGINYLGTGNVSALNSNTSLQTLLAMSAQRSGGKSYADILLDGINASETNALLKSMISYLAEIASSQENMVTKAAYAELFGMSITDLNSFINAAQYIEQIESKSQTYESLMGETKNQLNTISSRLNISQKINYVLENAMVGAAEDIGSVGALYASWKALSMLKDTVGEIKVPSIMAAGFGIGDLDLLNVAQTAMVGIGLITSLIGSLTSTKYDSFLDAFGYKEYRRGEGLSDLSSENPFGVSRSDELIILSGSAEDFETVTFEQAEQKGKTEYDKIVSEELAEEKGVDTEIYEALADSEDDIIGVTKDIRTILKGAFGGGVAGGQVTPESQGSPNTGSSNSGSGLGETSDAYQAAQEVIKSSETADKIYQLLEQSIISGNDTLISVIQGLSQTIEEKLNQERVFYTSIVSDSVIPNSTSDKLSNLSSQVTGGVVNGNITSQNPVDTSTGSSISSTPTNSTASQGSSLSSTPNNIDANMEAMITKAVETAIRNISGFSGNDGIPVYVTNIHGYEF